VVRPVSTVQAIPHVARWEQLLDTGLGRAVVIKVALHVASRVSEFDRHEATLTVPVR